MLGTTRSGATAVAAHIFIYLYAYIHVILKTALCKAITNLLYG